MKSSNLRTTISATWLLELSARARTFTGTVSAICCGVLPSDLIGRATKLAPMVCSLAMDLSFAQRIVIARTVKVDDVALAWVLEHWPIGKKRVPRDRGKF